MIRLGRTGALIVGILGCTLLIAAVLASYLWFYTLAPWRRISSYEWCRDHSRERVWEEDQKNIRRFMWYHDTWARKYGTKATARWLIERMEPGDDISSCGAGHKHDALQHTTNQDATNAAGWIAWWAGHGSKSQTEWIRDGFIPYGIDSLATSPGTNEVVALLDLVGNTETNATGMDVVPCYVRYNAFRWLRDSGFEPVPFALSNVTSRTAERTKRGLVEFASKARWLPATDRAGVLPLSRTLDRDHVESPYIFTPAVRRTVVAVIACAYVVGCGMIVYWRRGRRAE